MLEHDISQALDLLIGPLKLFLFLQITLHILQHSALRNPFVPAAKRKEMKKNSGNSVSKISEIIQRDFLLFVPPAVMNKVFDLFILDAYLNTLQKEIRILSERFKCILRIYVY